MSELEPIAAGRSLEDVQAALIELAVCGGNCAEASRRLGAQGVSVSSRTLLNWKTSVYPGRYERAREEFSHAMEERLTAECRERAALASEVERVALEKTRDQLEAGEVRDPAGTARNVAVVKGINVDQVLKLTGRPVVVQETRGVEDIMRALAAKLGSIDSSAIEVPADELSAQGG